MAELLSYVVVNGTKAKPYPFHAEVSTQEEIESHRETLLRKHAEEKKVEYGEELDFTVLFSIRQPQGSRLRL